MGLVLDRDRDLLVMMLELFESFGVELFGPDSMEISDFSSLRFRDRRVDILLVQSSVIDRF